MTDDQIIAKAISILKLRIKKVGGALNSPDAVKSFLTLQLGLQEHESFVVLFLDVKNRVIAYESMFRGTLTHSSVYPREIAKAALAHNAASIIVSHNHPSGIAEPSDADRSLTKVLKSTLAVFEITVLDHIIVAGDTTYSFIEHGIF